MVAFNLQFDPRMRRLRTVQESGRLGELVSAWYRIQAPGPSARWLQIQATGHWRSSTSSPAAASPNSVATG